MIKIVLFNVFAYVLIIFSSTNAAPELESCVRNEIYKVEYYRKIRLDDYIKLNTTINCNCNQKNNWLNAIQTNILYNSSSGSYYKEIMCSWPLLKTTGQTERKCKKWGTCKKIYMYKYGILRDEEKYVEAIEETCSCRRKSNCKEMSYHPRNMIDPFDDVLNYRCIEDDPIYFKACAPNQTYLVEIYQNQSNFDMGFKTVKLNSFIRCICDSDETPTDVVTQLDPIDKTVMIKTTACPRPKSREYYKSCEDIQICRFGYTSNVGLEEPERRVEQYITNFCKCDLDRSCKKSEEIVLRENEYQVIYRCNKKVRRQCYDNEVYKTEFYNTKGGYLIKTKTDFNCTCDRPYNDSEPHPHDLNYRSKTVAYQMVRCPKKNTTKLGLCTKLKSNQCQVDVWKDYGTRYPGAKYKDYSKYMCDCGTEKKCKLGVEYSFGTKSHKIYTCRIEYEVPQNSSCTDGAVFKTEYLKETPTSSTGGDLIKMSTRFMCLCHVYQSYRSPTPTKHPTEAGTWIKDYQCSRLNQSVEIKELDQCSDREICRTNYYNEYGSEKPGELYLDFSIRRCRCTRYRKCIFEPGSSNSGYEKHEYCLPVIKDLSKLPECDIYRIYKIEIHSESKYLNKGYIKMDTNIMCKCNLSRTSSLAGPELLPSDDTDQVLKFPCVPDSPRKPLLTGYELQICKREFIYYYGLDRHDDYYVDTTEYYVNCPLEKKLQCKEAVFLPKEVIDKYDKVLSYRCMENETEGLKPCDREQLFMLEIYRNETKLNTYLKCICEIDSIPKFPSEKYDTVKTDPTDTTQRIRSVLCPRVIRSSATASCVDYAICRTSNDTNIGEEKPNRMLSIYFTTYCRCDKERSCENVGGVGNQTIYRCINKRTSIRRKVCKDGALSRVDIHRYQYHGTSNGDDEKFRIFDNTKPIEIRLNTFEECKCLGEQVRQNDRDPNFEHDVITYIKCQIPRSHTTLPDEKDLSYCTRDEVCVTHLLESRGIENPEKAFESRSMKLCKCTFPRICAGEDYSSFLEKKISLDRCILSKNLTRRLYACGPDQLYKEVIYLNRTTLSGKTETDKMNTHVMCECELTVHEKYVEKKNISMDRRDEKLFIESHFCPRLDFSDKIDRCEDYAVCKREMYTDYGEDLDHVFTYLNHRILHCDCDENRTCNFTGQEYTDAFTYINTHRCLPVEEPGSNNRSCASDRNFLALVMRNLPDYTRGQMNAFVRCRCNYENRDTISQSPFNDYPDPTIPGDSIFKLDCPVVAPPCIKPCENNDVCFVEEYDIYGRERIGEYVLNAYELCHCEEPRVCARVGKRDGMRNVHRCIRRYCMVGEMCHVRIISAEKDLRKDQKLCHCEGDCSPRKIDSVLTSPFYGTETHVLDCKPLDGVPRIKAD